MHGMPSRQCRVLPELNDLVLEVDVDARNSHHMDRELRTPPTTANMRACTFHQHLSRAEQPASWSDVVL